MKTLLVYFCCLVITPLMGQETVILDLFKIDYETPLTIALKDLKAEENLDLIQDTKKKKKLNPKIYYGIKGKKGFVKKTRGNFQATNFVHKFLIKSSKIY